MNIDGTYEVVEMELWDKKDIDLVEPGYIRITGNRGELHFICVDGDMDIRRDKTGSYKFSWAGNDECDPVSGFGEFACVGDTLTGRIYFHDGDDSSFVAKKISEEREFIMVNRSLVIAIAKEPFREWLLSLPTPCYDTLEEINKDRTAYLIPEYEDDKQRDRALKKVFGMIFEDQLAEWWTRDEDWPQKRDLKTFRKWFDIQFHSVVEDLVDDMFVDE